MKKLTGIRREVRDEQPDPSRGERDEHPDHQRLEGAPAHTLGDRRGGDHQGEDEQHTDHLHRHRHREPDGHHEGDRQCPNRDAASLRDILVHRREEQRPIHQRDQHERHQPDHERETDLVLSDPEDLAEEDRDREARVAAVVQLEEERAEAERECQDDPDHGVAVAQALTECSDHTARRDARGHQADDRQLADDRGSRRPGEPDMRQRMC